VTKLDNWSRIGASKRVHDDVPPRPCAYVRWAMLRPSLSNGEGRTNWEAVRMTV
jgi:hypothetical protein